MSEIKPSDLQFPDDGPDASASGDAPREVDSEDLLFPSADTPDFAAQPAAKPASTKQQATPTTHPAHANETKPTDETPNIPTHHGEHAASSPAEATTAMPAVGKEEVRPPQPPKNGFDMPVWSGNSQKNTQSSQRRQETTQLIGQQTVQQHAAKSTAAQDNTRFMPPQQAASGNQDDAPTVAFQPLNTATARTSSSSNTVPAKPVQDDDDIFALANTKPEPENKEPNNRRRIIIGVIVAVAVIALIVAGVIFWRSHQSTQEKNDALATCEKSEQTVATAYETLDAQVKSAQSASAITADQVSDAKTVSTLADSLKQARAAQKEHASAQTVCAASLDTAALQQSNKELQSQVSDVQKLAVQIKSNVSAVEQSKAAKASSGLKDELNSAISDAQTVYDNSAGAVADESTRTALEAAIAAAKQVADNANMTQDAVDKAKTALTDAVTVVQDSEYALSAANEAAAQQQAEQLAQQQAAQQQAEQLAQQQAAQQQQQLQTQQNTNTGTDTATGTDTGTTNNTTTDNGTGTTNGTDTGTTGDQTGVTQ